MQGTVHRLGAAILAGLVVAGGLAPAAHGQSNFNPNRFPSNRPIISPQPLNPNFQVAPGLSLNQAAFNTAVIGRALQQVPPYALGFNPYSSPQVFSPAMSFPSPILSTFGGGAGCIPHVGVDDRQPLWHG